MNAMTTFAAQPQTMTSIEIAELTGKRHDHVMRDIRRMMLELAGPKNGGSDFESYYKDVTGRRLPCYRLERRECMILVAGYSIMLQARTFQDWVTRDVLPALRKDGVYMVGEERLASGDMSEDQLILTAMDRLRAKVERLEVGWDAAVAKVTEQVPKFTVVIF